MSDIRDFRPDLVPRVASAPLSGLVGNTPTTHHRISFDALTLAPSVSVILRLSDLFLYGGANKTNPISLAGASIISSTYAYNVAGYDMTNALLVVKDIQLKTALTVHAPTLLPITLDIILPTPQTVIGFGYTPLGPGGSTAAATMFSYYQSFDNGATWLNVYPSNSVVQVPKNGVVAFADITANTYPTNPSNGQTFFNETTQTRMRWDGTTWVMANPITSPINTWQQITTAYTAIVWDRLEVDSSGGTAFSITLPTGIKAGSEIEMVDVAGTWGTTNVTLVRGATTDKIMGISQDLVLNVSNRTVQLHWTGTDWRLK